MIRVKTRNMEIIREDNAIISAVPAMNSLYLKFEDGIEVTIPIKLDQKLTAMLNLLATSSAPNITIDLTDPSCPVKFTS